MRILLIEDEELVSNFLEKLLKKDRFVVRCVNNFKSAKECLLTNDFDLIILDRKLPKFQEGLDLIPLIREQQKSVPLLVLSAVRGPLERVKALDAGADDYLEKPYDYREFLARVHALLRRGDKIVLPEKVGTFEIDEARGEISLDEKVLDLKLKEFQLLRYLLRNADRLVSEREVLESVWDDENLSIRSNTVNVHVMRLRKKIGPHRSKLKTLRGKGFLFEFNPKKNG